MKEKATKVDLIKDIPLDIPGAFLRFERRHWKDGTSCLHVMKWGTQPETGRQAPWWPLQYIQVPWELREKIQVNKMNIRSFSDNVGTTKNLVLRWQKYNPEYSHDIDLHSIETYCCDHMRTAINNEGRPFHMRSGRLTLRVNPKALDDDPDAVEEIEVTFCPFCMSQIINKITQ